MQFSEPIRHADTQEANKEADNVLQIDYHNIKKAPVIPNMIKTTKVNIPRNPSGLTNLVGSVNFSPMNIVLSKPV